MEKDKRIFIQIASYRDPQIVPTIKHCIRKAKHPENLRFGICWQHSVDDSWDSEFNELKTDSRIKFIDVPWNESKGCCWARNSIQEQLYDGEPYTLQLDSHHRFLQNWDELCIGWVLDKQAKGHAKPLFTSYINGFNPANHTCDDDDAKLNNDSVLYLEFDRFTPEGVVFFKPHHVDGSGGWAGSTPKNEMTEGYPGRFMSAHFAFSVGAMVTEVPHDPNYYFHGEEISIAMRAYTHGYDLFTPHLNVAWHEYTREYREHKHWVDHVDTNKHILTDNKNWVERNSNCHLRNRILFDMESNKIGTVDFGKYGMGKVRTLEQYEEYSQLDFKRRAQRVSDDPNMRNYALQLNWKWEDFHQANDLEFVVLAVHGGADNETFWREDVTKDRDPMFWDREYKTTDDLRIRYNRKIITVKAGLDLPKIFVILPYSKSQGWMKRVELPLTIEQLGY